MNEVAALLMLALVGIAAWAVLGPYQRGDAAVLERATDPLEDERGRALRHLRDLDEDLALGKLDEDGHRAARAEAEVRAVAVLRALETREGTGELSAGLREVRQPSTRAAPPPASRWRRLAVASLAVALVVGATALLLTRATRARDGDQTITGSAPAQPGGSASLEVFEQRVREHPDDIAARLDLGQRYLDAGRVKEATNQYLATLKLDPGNVQANTNLALLLFQSGLANEALRSVDRALATDPRYPEALYAKGLILFMGLRQPDSAAAAFRAYLAAAPFGAHRDTAERLLRLTSAKDPP